MIFCAPHHDKKTVISRLQHFDGNTDPALALNLKKSDLFNDDFLDLEGRSVVPEQQRAPADGPSCSQRSTAARQPALRPVLVAECDPVSGVKLEPRQALHRSQCHSQPGRLR
ncbi:hypothetical protein SBV1_2460004 [Verrucomicrobia bacterium]|nr:hypothetical protein SBV1_2460004 [Verrucomicrobiota bacterium]